MHISKVSKSFNEEVSFLFNDDNVMHQNWQRYLDNVKYSYYGLKVSNHMLRLSISEDRIYE